MKRKSECKKTLDLVYPELAKQWHPTKNGDLRASMVTFGSNKKVWWYFPYDDPKTGKHFDFEWKATVLDRTKGAGCPFLTGNAVWPGFNDLKTKRPDLAAQWHPTKNGSLEPNNITYGSKKKVWWHLRYDDPETGKNFVFEWQASLNARVCGNGCPFLTGQAVWKEYNDLETRYPDIAKQWHPTKNGNIHPSDISYASNKKYWWTDTHIDHVLGPIKFEWEAKVVNRTLLGEGCPFIGNDRVWVGYNDLESQYPNIAAEWHPTKNGTLTPKDVVYGSQKRVWWCIPYDDPETGRHFDFEWRAPINIRTGVGTNDGHQTGCPYLAPNPKVWKGYNDLESCCPDIAVEWNQTKNRKHSPDGVYKHSTKKVWWKCAKCGHEWYAPVKGRVIDGSGCPVCRKTANRYV